MSAAALACGGDAESPLAPEAASSAGAAVPAGTLPFAQVDPGFFHTCGVTTGGTAYCWGDNVFHQLGDGTDVVLGTRRYRGLNVGSDHTCGVTLADRAVCWGVGAGGRLGDGGTSFRDYPVPVLGPE
ncbi:MAG TPA: hypothetical protein VEB59_16430 [Gemmatimonadales bacterium]|nr:hypothetical protein [Gemmatimonadales bacterium]